MYRNIRNGVALCLLVAAAAGTWYLSRPAAPDQAGIKPTSDNPLGYYLRDAVLLGTGEDGTVLYRIFADLAEERPEDGRLMLTGVRIEYQPTEQVPWRLHAETAEALTDPDRSYLELAGDVKLARDATDEHPRTVVETDELRLAPQQHLASTDGPVSVIVGGHTVHATGLKAFLKDDRLELAEIHGQFAP